MNAPWSWFSAALLTTATIACGTDERADPDVDGAHQILFERRTFVPAPDVDGFLTAGSRHGLLQFYETPQTLAPLREEGIEVHGAQPNHSYYVTVPDGLIGEQLRSLGARALFEMQPLDKISTRLIPRGDDEPSEEISPRVSLRYVPDTPIPALMAAVHAMDGTVISLDEVRGSARLELPLSSVLELAGEPWTWWFDADLGPLAPNMDIAAERIGTHEVWPPPWGSAAVGTGLTGAGVAVGIWEAPLEDGSAAPSGTHPDLLGRVIVGPGQPEFPSFHATNVAGVVAGNGTQSQAHGGAPLQWTGIAPEAQIISWDALGSAGEMAMSLALFDTTITNHSFGPFIMSPATCGLAGIYDDLDAAYDDVVRVSSITAVVSAGNNGEQVGLLDCPIEVWDDGAFVPLAAETIDVGYGSVSALGVAKNAIAVGGRRKSQPLGTTSYSGRGPTHDGRLKPDIVAISGDEESPLTMPSTPEPYTSDLGVSFAAPQVAGAAALLLEHYRKSIPTLVQDPAVFKAVLANTAADVGAPGPDYANGYGLIQVPEAIAAADSFMIIPIDQGDVELLSLSIDVSGACGLRVMAAWSDPPSMGPASMHLINDIDLSVASGASEVLPWVLTPSNPLNLATHGINSVDNVEQVTVDEPTGDEVIRLEGTDIAMGPQDVVLHWYAVPCDAGADTGNATDDGGSGDGGAGCACSSGSPSAPGVPWLLLVPSLARRRR